MNARKRKGSTPKECSGPAVELLVKRQKWCGQQVQLQLLLSPFRTSEVRFWCQRSATRRHAARRSASGNASSPTPPNYKLADHQVSDMLTRSLRVLRRDPLAAQARHHHPSPSPSPLSPPSVLTSVPSARLHHLAPKPLGSFARKSEQSQMSTVCRAQGVDQDQQQSDKMPPKTGPTPRAWSAVPLENTVPRLAGQKRSVAIHVGYVGTGYHGLMVTMDKPRVASVEGVLELALLKANLIAETNYGDLFKVIGVKDVLPGGDAHVIGVKVVLPGGDAVFNDDSEGTKLASQINGHLPDTIRVYSVQRVNKKFSARRQCAGRSYEYYLPTSMIGIQSPDDMTDDDKKKLRYRSTSGSIHTVLL
eukprot:gene30028-17922_t